MPAALRHRLRRLYPTPYFCETKPTSPVFSTKVFHRSQNKAKFEALKSPQRGNFPDKIAIGGGIRCVLCGPRHFRLSQARTPPGAGHPRLGGVAGSRTFPRRDTPAGTAGRERNPGRRTPAIAAARRWRRSADRSTPRAAPPRPKYTFRPGIRPAPSRARSSGPEARGRR